MLKTGRDDSGEVEQAVGKVSVAAAVPWYKKIFSSRRNLIICGALILAAVGGTLAFVLVSQSNEDDIPTQTWTPINEEQAVKAEHESLKNNAPTASDSAQVKTIYYGRLQYSSAQNGDYQGAIDAFKQRETLEPKALTYKNYIEAAGYYKQIDDDASAQAAYDKAATLLPPNDDPQEGYSYKGELAFINSLRTEN